MDQSGEIQAQRERWWRAWREADYSWEGLGRHWASGCVDATGIYASRDPGPGERAATLQDVWRGHEAHLIEERDAKGAVVRHWTRAHLPPRFETGRPAKEMWSASEWEALQADLEALISTLNGAGFEQDDYIPLRGIVLWTFPALDYPNLSLDLRQSATLGGSSARVDAFDGKLLAMSCLFEGVLDLRDCVLQQATDFSDSVFCSSALFHGVDFKFRGARFRKAFFGTETSFALSRARQIELNEAVVLGEAYLNGAIIETAVDLSSARIGRYLFADDLQADSVNFSQAQFGGNFRAENIKVRSMFGRDANIVGNFNLTSAICSGSFYFDGLNVSGNFVLMNSKLGTETGQLAQHSFFDRVAFRGAADFTGVSFASGVSFRSARFEGPADFRGAAWPSQPQANGIFRDCRFERLAEFRSSVSVPFAAFDGASVKAEVRINRQDVLSDRQFNAQLKSHADEDGLEALENGCRVLKLAADACRDKLSEQSFYRFELRARRARRTTQLTERIASSLYEGVSNFGLSFTRPIASLFLAWIVFAALYLLLSKASASPPVLFSALELAGEGIFRPFYIWGKPCASSVLADDLWSAACTQGPGTIFATRLVSTSQSIVATILLFLAGLAVKRRFQIS